LPILAKETNKHTPGTMTNPNTFETELAEARELTCFYEQRMYNTGHHHLYVYYQAEFMKATTRLRELIAIGK